jgi:alpha-1,2-mannosyltransferase
VSDATIEAGPRLRGADLFAKATFAGAVFLAVFVVGYLACTNPPRDALGYLIGRDFVNTWMGARAALSGDVGRLSDFHFYLQVLHQTFGALPAHNWSYPPHILLFVWPLGFLPYLPACALWSAIGLALYLAVAAREDRSPLNLLFLAVAPAVAMNLFAGQNGFFTATLLILAVRHMDRKPIVAGICLGLLTIKPQLAILFPFALLLSGRIRCFTSAALTTSLLIALSGAVFGTGVWIDYLRLAIPFQNEVMNYGTGIFIPMMPTAFMNARLWDASPVVAWLVQAPFSLLAIAAVVWTFGRRRDPALSFAVLITAGFVVTPYIFDYDMVVFGWLIAVLRPRLSGIWDARLALAVWTLPVTTILFGLCHLPVSAPILAAFLLRLVWLLRNDASQAVRY